MYISYVPFYINQNSSNLCIQLFFYMFAKNTSNVVLFIFYAYFLPYISIPCIVVLAIIRLAGREQGLLLPKFKNQTIFSEQFMRGGLPLPPPLLFGASQPHPSSDVFMDYGYEIRPIKTKKGLGVWEA